MSINIYIVFTTVSLFIIIVGVVVVVLLEFKTLSRVELLNLSPPF